MSRDRSLSDAHDLVYFKRNSDHTPALGTNADSAINQVSVPSIFKRTNACSHRKHHHQAHGNSRPRSKSLDVHRHSTTPVHKKKYAHHHAHPRTQSPGGGHQHHGGNGLIDAIMADNATTKKLQGKMWIRPAAASSPVPFPFHIVTNAASVPVPDGHHSMIEDGLEFTIISPTSASNDPFPRQVTDASFFPSPDPSFDDEMKPASFATSPDLSSSFDQYHQVQGRRGTTRIIFGESGKPIKPRNAYLAPI
ncbi:hypothetical protein ACHAXA_008764 [Cyclostephanos tholiformis]|uniref:Uncharacterized protein n=1 Tax=Cyclostephanos tholiformis TaxID=382380 RepID=A0ABD3RDR8_9STRA